MNRSVTIHNREIAHQVASRALADDYAEGGDYADVPWDPKAAASAVLDAYEAEASISDGRDKPTAFALDDADRESLASAIDWKLDDLLDNEDDDPDDQGEIERLRNLQRRIDPAGEHSRGQ